VSRREFWDQIHRIAAEGTTVLVTTHYMDEAERCHRLAFIFRGETVLDVGTPTEIVERAACGRRARRRPPRRCRARSATPESRRSRTSAGAARRAAAADGSRHRRARGARRASGPFTRAEASGRATVEDAFVSMVREDEPRAPSVKGWRMTRFLAIAGRSSSSSGATGSPSRHDGGLPVLQLLLFGYAINTDVRNIPTVVFDQDGSAESRDLVRRLEATGFYDVVGHVRLRRDRRAMRGTRTRGSSCPRVRRANIRGRARRAGAARVDGSDPQTVASATHTAASLSAALSMDRCSSSRRRAHRRGSRADHGADHLVQPRAAHGGLHRAGAHRRHPHDDDGDAHRDGHRPRARARHARAAHRLAGAPPSSS
jgi:hypothetical protein